MSKIIKDLWYGNIAPIDEIDSTPEMNKKRGELLELYEKLLDSLNKEQKKLLNEYEELSIELSCLREEFIFEHAFKLGVNLVLEAQK